MGHILEDPFDDMPASRPGPDEPGAANVATGHVPFVHLHTHMETSMMDGASRIPDAVAEAARLGQHALAITDHGVLSGTWKFAQACQATTDRSHASTTMRDGNGTVTLRPLASYAGEPVTVRVTIDGTPADPVDTTLTTSHTTSGPVTVDVTVDDMSCQVAVTVTADVPDGTPMRADVVFAGTSDLVGVKPIMGMEAYLAIGSRFEHNAIDVPTDDETTEGEKTKRYEHVTLLAMNTEGWRNLTTLQNKSHDTFWYKPRIDYDLMAEHSDGIICMTGCLAGPILGPVARHMSGQARRDAAAAEADRVRPELDSAKAALGGVIQELRDIAAERGVGDKVPTRVRPDVILDAAKHLFDEDDIEGGAVVELVADMFNEYETVRSRWEKHHAAATWDGVEEARRNLDRLVSIYGRDRVFVELMEHGIAIETAAVPQVAQLAADAGVTCVVTNDSHYVHEEDATSHDAWLALQAGQGDKARVDNPDRFRFNGHGYFICSGAQIASRREEQFWQDGVANTVTVAAMVDADVLPPRYLRLPAFPPPAGFDTSAAYFRHLVREGVRDRYGSDPDDVVKDRIRREVRVITDLGLVDYFLIVHDVISWSRSDYTAADWITARTGGTVDDASRERKKPIMVGPGRGSAAGSAVSYALRIVDIDPIRFDLLFERFLDPTRVGMPDIDVDVERDRRNEILAYMKARWGAGQVARIGSFTKAKSRAAIKNAARVLGVSPTLQNRLTKSVPLVDGRYPTVHALRDTEVGNRLRSVLDTLDDEQARLGGVPAGGAGSDDDDWDGDVPGAGHGSVLGGRVMELAAAFEDLTSGEGIHACGLLISDVPMVDLIPVRVDHKANADPDAPSITQWDGKDADSFGLLKLDLLGLRTLDMISAALDAASRLEGRTITLDDIPDPDDHAAPGVAATWRMLSEGRTASVFQLESSGMTELAERVAPDSLEDLSALVALYRPGPLSAGMHTHYADRKNGREPVDYSIFTREPREEEIIRDVLGSTFGLTVYQEQSMLLGQRVAGFDVAQTNRLRKAISKKIVSEFEALGEQFVSGAMSSRTSDGDVKVAFRRSTAEALWDTIKGSASYAFNKAHSAAYGYVAYMTAWLKANHPAAFGAASLSVTESDDKRHAVMMSLQAEGIDVRQPDVNASFAVTSATDERTVVLGIAEVKGMSSEAAAGLVRARDEGGLFVSLADVAHRVPSMGSGDLVALVESGAVDAFGSRLGQVMVARALRARPDTRVPDAEWGPVQRWRRQHDRVGIGVGPHPILEVKDQLVNFRRSVDGDDVEVGMPVTALNRVGDREGETSLTVGLVSSWSLRPLASGGVMANLTLETTRARYDAVAWTDAVTEVEDRVGVGSFVQALVKPTVREIEIAQTDGEDVESDEVAVVKKTELVVRRFFPIDVVDEERPDAVTPLDGSVDWLSVCRGEVVQRPKPARKPGRSAVRDGDDGPGDGDGGGGVSGRTVMKPPVLRNVGPQPGEAVQVGLFDDPLLELFVTLHAGEPASDVVEAVSGWVRKGTRDELARLVSNSSQEGVYCALVFVAGAVAARVWVRRVPKGAFVGGRFDRWPVPVAADPDRVMVREDLWEGRRTHRRDDVVFLHLSDDDVAAQVMRVGELDGERVAA